MAGADGVEPDWDAWGDDWDFDDDKLDGAGGAAEADIDVDDDDDDDDEAAGTSAGAVADARVAAQQVPGARRALEDEDDEEQDGEGRAGDWLCLTGADLEADLVECEECAADASAAQQVGHAGAFSEDRLQKALHHSAASGSSTFDTGAFFAAPRALGGIAAELQELLADLDHLTFEAATLTASLTHGPLRPPQLSGASAGGGGGPSAPRRPGRWVGRPGDEVFGFSGADLEAKPPPIDASLPSSATCLTDYQRRLEALPHVFFLKRPLRLCVGDVDKYQDGKDIGRDSLVVNGAAISGAQGGYAAAVDALAQGIAHASADGGCPCEASSLASPPASQRAAELLLSVLNRTSSGFAAFEEVLRVFDCMDAVIVSPDSAAARPLEAAVLGGCALGRAHTRYAIRTAAGEGEPLAVVDAEFSFKVPFRSLSNLVAQHLDGGRDEAWPHENTAATVILRWT